jgi:hypothetical protein
MNDEPHQLTIEQKIVFANSPRGQGDGVTLLLVGVPRDAWVYMKDGKTHHFDLTQVGMPVKMILFGARNHDAAMAVLQESAKSRGEAYLDERRRDFSIKPEPATEPPEGKITRDPDYPAEIAQLLAMFNRCADGYESDAVLKAALEMVAAAIGFIVKSKGDSLEDAEAYTGRVAEGILRSVRDNWQREAQASDVLVKPS